MARLVNFFRVLMATVLVYTVLNMEMVDATTGVIRKRQLVIGRVGFRPGRSLAIGRTAFLKPSGKRSNMEMGTTLAPTLNDVLIPGFRNEYCSAEREETADALFAGVVQAMQELRQFAVICYGTDPAQFQDQPQPKPEDRFEYYTEEI